MSLIKFIEQFTDDRFLNAKADRRQSMGQFGFLGKGLALASIPFGLSVFTHKLFAADITPTPATPTGALQLALTLEYLEAEYYEMGLNADIIPAGRDRAIFEQISKHESAHVSFLEDALGDDAPQKPTFDFTAGDTFDPFNDYQQFLALAQAFEDTGVRAYKGQAGNLLGNAALLTAALQIHSVEARHASEVRRLRMEKGWIEGNSNTLPPQAQAVYAGEELTLQAGFNTATAFGAPAGSAAFDEPLTTQQSVTIANLFIV